ncbi:hypothetical protein ABK040_004984 [Willaertia magna]
MSHHNSPNLFGGNLVNNNNNNNLNINNSNPNSRTNSPNLFGNIFNSSNNTSNNSSNSNSPLLSSHSPTTTTIHLSTTINNNNNNNELTIEQLSTILEQYYGGYFHQNPQEFKRIELLLQEQYGKDSNGWKRALFLLNTTINNLNNNNNLNNKQVVSGQHVQWFSLTLLEETIHHYYLFKNLNLNEKFEIKNTLMNCLKNYKNVSAAIWKKICKVIVELAKVQWPTEWPTFIDDIFQISNLSLLNNNTTNQSTLTTTTIDDHLILTLTILQMLSEEIISINVSTNILLGSEIMTSSRNSEDLLHERKLELKNELNKYLFKILTFLENILVFIFNHLQQNLQQNLQQSLQNDKLIELAIFSFECLNHFLTWIDPLEILNYPNLVNIIFNYIYLYKNQNNNNLFLDLSCKSLNTCYEIIIKNFRLNNTNMEIINNFYLFIYKNLISLLEDFKTIILEDDLNDKILLLFLGFCENHLLKMEINNIYFLLNLFLNFTFNQINLDSFKQCIDLWNIILEQLLNLENNDEEDDNIPVDNIDNNKPIYGLTMTLYQQLLQTILFTKKNKFLNELNDTKKDPIDNLTEYDKFLDNCSEIIGNCCELNLNILYHFINLYFEKNNFNTLQNSLQQNTLQQDLNEQLKDERIYLILFSRLAPLFTSNFNLNFIELIIKLINKWIFDLNLFLNIDLINKYNQTINKTIEEIFITLQHYIRWIVLYQNYLLDNNSINSNNNIEINTIEKYQIWINEIINIILKVNIISTNFTTINYELIDNSNNLLLLFINAFNNYKIIPLQQHLLLNQIIINNLSSFIELYINYFGLEKGINLSNKLILIFINSYIKGNLFNELKIIFNNQINNKFFKLDNPNLLNIYYKIIKNIIYFINKENRNVIFNYLLKETSLNLENILSILSNCFNNLNDITLPLIEIILDCFYYSFENLKIELHLPYMVQVITYLLEILKNNNKIFLEKKNIFVQFLKLIKSIIMEGSNKNNNILNNIINIFKEFIYLNLNILPIEVILIYHECIYQLLNYHFKYFINLDEFHFLFNNLLQNLQNGDITLFKNTITHLDDLNDHHLLFKNDNFKNNYYNNLLNILIQTLISKNFNLYRDQLITLIFNICNSQPIENRWNIFINGFIKHFLESSKLLIDQKHLLFNYFVMDLNNNNNGYDRTLFAIRLNQFTNDYAFYLKQNNHTGLSFLIHNQ